jgi:hypothetical protein
LIVQTLRGYGLSAAWHFYDGPSTNPGISECSDPNLRRAVLIITGLAATQFNMALYGSYTGPNLNGGAGLVPRGPATAMSEPLPIRIGPPLPSLPLPLFVPEPSEALLAVAAIAALGGLAGRRRNSVL